MRPDLTATLRQRHADILGAIRLDVGDGWYHIVDRLCHELTECDPAIVATEVKSKFGGLRFYTGKLSGVARDRIRDAEERSFRTCEGCGEPGAPKSFGGWIVTTCGGKACSPRGIR